MSNKKSSCLPTESVDYDQKNMYQKRLRSWKRNSKPCESLSSSMESSMIETRIESDRRSTFFTYPIRRSYMKLDEKSDRIPSESVTSESVFYASTIPKSPMKLADDINNNHMTRLHPIFGKRKPSSTSPSCESLASQWSPTNSKTVSNISETIEKSLMATDDIPHLLCPTSPSKRRRFSTDDLLIMDRPSNTSVSNLDSCTIDINQSNHHLSSRSSKNEASHMDTAVKMVQPIVDIIFDAFEHQLQTNELISRTTASSEPSTEIVPYRSPRRTTRPITLHAVHFNIQLSPEKAKRALAQTNSSLYEPSMDKEHSFSVCFNELKHKLLSNLLTTPYLNDRNTLDMTVTQRHSFQHMIRLAIVGASVFCGYWML